MKSFKHFKKLLSIILSLSLVGAGVVPVGAREFLAVPGERERISSEVAEDLRTQGILNEAGLKIIISKKAGNKIQAMDKLYLKHNGQHEFAAYGLIQEDSAGNDILVDIILPRENKILYLDELSGDPEIVTTSEYLFEKAFFGAKQLTLRLKAGEIYLESDVKDASFPIYIGEWRDLRRTLGSLSHEKFPENYNEIKKYIIKKGAIPLDVDWDLVCISNTRIIGTKIYEARVNKEAERQNAEPIYDLHYHPAKRESYEEILKLSGHDLSTLIKNKKKYAALRASILKPDIQEVRGVLYYIPGVVDYERKKLFSVVPYFKNIIMEELFDRYQHAMELWILVIDVFSEENYPDEKLDKFAIISEVMKSVELLSDDYVLPELKKHLDHNIKRYLNISSHMNMEDVFYLMNTMIEFLDYFLIEVNFDDKDTEQYARQWMQTFLLLSRYISIKSKDDIWIELKYMNETTAEILTKLSHPALSKVRKSGDKYEVKRIKGMRLNEWVENMSKLHPDREYDNEFLRQIIFWGLYIADAVIKLHEEGVEHGDLFPVNIIVSEDITDRAVLVDIDDPVSPDVGSIRRLILLPLISRARATVSGVIMSPGNAKKVARQLFGDEIFNITKYPASYSSIKEFKERLEAYYCTHWDEEDLVRFERTNALELYARSLDKKDKDIFYRFLTSYIAATLHNKVIVISEEKQVYAKIKRFKYGEYEIIELFVSNAKGETPKDLIKKFKILNRGEQILTHSKGTFGFIEFRFFDDEGNPAFYIHEIHPSPGLKKMWKKQKELYFTECREWSHKAVLELFKIARKYGCEIFYAQSDDKRNFKNSGLTYGSRREYYRRPFRDFQKEKFEDFWRKKGTWPPVEITWKFKDVFADIEPDVSFRKLLYLTLRAQILYMLKGVVWEPDTVAEKIARLDGITEKFIDWFESDVGRTSVHLDGVYSHNINNIMWKVRKIIQEKAERISKINNAHSEIEKSH